MDKMIQHTNLQAADLRWPFKLNALSPFVHRTVLLFILFFLLRVQAGCCAQVCNYLLQPYM